MYLDYLMKSDFSFTIQNMFDCLGIQFTKLVFSSPILKPYSEQWIHLFQAGH